MNNLFICPLCQNPLHLLENRYICPNQHSFDRAKSGYVNLLLSQKSSQHGDDKCMVSARSRFLNKGYFNPLLETLCAQALQYAPKNCVLLDAGCGEGFYTAAVEYHLLHHGLQPTVLALDISKDALNAAAKRSKTLHLAVASVFHLPIQPQSCDILLTVFAPYSGTAFQRVLKDKGLMIMVIPLESHLWSLKCAVYDKPYFNQVADYALEGFSLLECKEIRTQIHLPCQEDIAQLFTMTPYYYKTGVKDQAKLESLQQLDTETAFAVLVYEKNGAPIKTGAKI